jgi:hypothetical protein
MLKVSGILIELVAETLRWLRLAFLSSQSIQAENLFLRRQLALYIERGVKPPRIDLVTRTGLTLLSRCSADSFVAESPTLSAANQFSADCIMNTRWSLLAPDLSFADDRFSRETRDFQYRSTTRSYCRQQSNRSQCNRDGYTRGFHGRKQTAQQSHCE